MKYTKLMLFALMLSSGQSAWSQQQAQASGDKDALLAKCTKLLNYGEQVQSYKPSKLDAVSTMGLLGDERAVPVLVDHLQNEENNNLRYQIVKALGWIGGTNAVPALESALNDKYPYVRAAAATALKDITGKDYDYDKTGLPDMNRMKEFMRSLTNASGKAIEKEP